VSSNVTALVGRRSRAAAPELAMGSRRAAPAQLARPVSHSLATRRRRRGRPRNCDKSDPLRGWSRRSASTFAPMTARHRCFARRTRRPRLWVRPLPGLARCAAEQQAHSTGRFCYRNHDRSAVQADSHVRSVHSAQVNQIPFLSSSRQNSLPYQRGSGSRTSKTSSSAMT